MRTRFNWQTGKLDLVGSGTSSSADNFSYYNITIGQTVTIPDGQMMLLDGGIVIDGSLIIDGILEPILDPSDFCLDRSLIEDNEVLKIRPNRRMLFADSIQIDGSLIIEGQLLEVS